MTKKERRVQVILEEPQTTFKRSEKMLASAREAFQLASHRTGASVLHEEIVIVDCRDEKNKPKKMNCS